jgi:replicative DNA helicase
MTARDAIGAANLRVPPHSVEAEQSLLGGLLLDNSAWDLLGRLGAADLYLHEHRLIFGAISSLVTATKPADVVTVFERLQADGKADDVGGLSYINSLASSVPSARNTRTYVEIIRKHAMLRALIGAADEAASQAWAGGDVGSIIESLSSKLGRLDSAQVRQMPRPLDAIVVELIDRINEAHENKGPAASSTKIPALDAMLNGGVRPGMLLIVGARPATGKSSFAGHLALTFAEQGLSTLVLSMEMTDFEVGMRVLSRASGIGYGTLATGQLEKEDWAGLAEGIDRLGALPLYVDDQSGLRLSDIKSKARHVKGLNVLIVDYLQLTSGTGSEANRNAEIELISRGLKALAKDMGITVIALSQLNREVEKRPNKRPNLADLRDSGSIEQDADVVAFLWPVRDFPADGRKLIGLAVEKNRSGRTGQIGLDFHGATHRWSESTADINPPLAPRTSRDDL